MRIKRTSLLSPRMTEFGQTEIHTGSFEVVLILGDPGAKKPLGDPTCAILQGRAGLSVGVTGELPVRLPPPRRPLWDYITQRALREGTASRRRGAARSTLGLVGHAHPRCLLGKLKPKKFADPEYLAGGGCAVAMATSPQPTGSGVLSDNVIDRMKEPSSPSGRAHPQQRSAPGAVNEEELKKRIAEELALERARRDSEAQKRRLKQEQTYVRDELGKLLERERAASNEHLARAVLRERAATEEERQKAQRFFPLILAYFSGTAQVKQSGAAVHSLLILESVVSIGRR
ncbi:PREDICTED: uncharacterized protein LOC104574285 [Tinamus guttatus]|uniref:uncharacterized protein LOC104574285 n=1 Tax=Tinamus guttatus TaxID=94827 RepID=UPI00052F4183|nr:PREDICTED: uncharacterized protein LOC104574285 [Tinamus guttatus]